MKFLLDENFSHKLNVLGSSLDYPLRHVQHVPELGERSAGGVLGHGASDDDIAEWCAEKAHPHVLVTADDDFRMIHAKATVLQQANVEVIFCTPQPRGQRVQVEYIVGHIPKWLAALEAMDAGCRLWVQRPRSFKVEAEG